MNGVSARCQQQNVFDRMTENLSELLHNYKLSCTLRSSSAMQLTAPSVYYLGGLLPSAIRPHTFGSRSHKSFPNIDSLSTFKSCLKIHFFKLVYSAWFWLDWLHSQWVLCDFITSHFISFSCRALIDITKLNKKYWKTQGRHLLSSHSFYYRYAACRDLMC